MSHELEINQNQVGSQRSIVDKSPPPATGPAPSVPQECHDCPSAWSLHLWILPSRGERTGIAHWVIGVAIEAWGSVGGFGRRREAVRNSERGREVVKGSERVGLTVRRYEMLCKTVRSSDRLCHLLERVL